MNILLVCQGGASTGALAKKMMETAPEGTYINAISVELFESPDFESEIEKYDVFLIGPQVRYRMDEFKKHLKKFNKHAISSISFVMYGRMLGKEVYKLAKETYEASLQNE